MAIMYPESISAYNPTASEKNFFNALKEQLSDDYYVFYSIKWFTIENGKRKNSECDFLVFNRRSGYVTIEVKGGRGMIREGDKWTLLLSDSHRELKKSPFDQSEDSMRYFKKYYESEVNQFYKGGFGFAVAFPNFMVGSDMGPDAPKNLILDVNDMKNLEQRVKEIMFYWKNKNNKSVSLTKAQSDKFISIVNKRIAISAAAGALIEYKKNQFEIINRVQDNYLELLKNYKKYYLVGGAGTGKTWIGIKKAIKASSSGKKVLFLCTSPYLAKFIESELTDYNSISIRTLEQFVSEIEELNKTKIEYPYEQLPDMIENIKESIDYDCIVIDEAQDFTENWAFAISLLIEDQSELVVMYDEAQNVFERNFGNQFFIDYPSFVLTENLRNTANIYKYAVEKTRLGNDVHPNTIEGITPEISFVSGLKSARAKVEKILNTLINKEAVSNHSITILSDVRIEDSIITDDKSIANWNFVDYCEQDNEIRFSEIKEYKGLEADVIIILRHTKLNCYEEYVAYTRARFYLFEMIID